MNKSDNKIFGLLVILEVSFVVIPPIGWLQNCNREKRGFFFTFFDDWVKSLYYRSNFYFCFFFFDQLKGDCLFFGMHFFLIWYVYRLRPFHWQRAVCGEHAIAVAGFQMQHCRCHSRWMFACGSSWRNLWRTLLILHGIRPWRLTAIDKVALEAFDELELGGVEAKSHEGPFVIGFKSEPFPWILQRNRRLNSLWPGKLKSTAWMILSPWFLFS